MNKENCTKRPTRLYKQEEVEDQPEQYVLIGKDGDGEDVQLLTVHHEGVEWDQFEANAELIAEAFNVLHDRGYTPLELIEHKGILIAALENTLRVLVTPKGFPNASHRTTEQQAAYDQAREAILRTTR